MSIVFGAIGILITVLFLGVFVWGLIALTRFILRTMRESPAQDSQGKPVESHSHKPVETKTQGATMTPTHFMQKNAMVLRFVMVGIIALLMAIPLSNIGSVVQERHQLYKKVLRDIASQWGKPQVIKGPMLLIPITEKRNIEESYKTNDGTVKTTNKVVYYKKHPRLSNSIIIVLRS